MKTDKNSIFAERIREIRGTRTQQIVADIIGVNKNAWWRWESGLSEPDISQLILIATRFSVSIDWLLGIEKTQNENPSPPPYHLEVLHKAEAVINCAEEMKLALSEKINALKRCL